MTIADDEAPRKRAKHEIGEDLSKLSLDELAERISILRSEIARIDAVVSGKKASASAAESIFKR